MGGACTICSLILILYFVVVYVLGTLIPPGQFKTTNEWSLSDRNEAGVPNIMSVPMEKLYVAYHFVAGGSIQ